MSLPVGGLSSVKWLNVLFKLTEWPGGATCLTPWAVTLQLAYASILWLLRSLFVQVTPYR